MHCILIMKKLLLIVASVANMACCWGQGTYENDSIEFERHLSNTFAAYYPIFLLQSIYLYMTKYEADKPKERYVRSVVGEYNEGNCKPADSAQDGLAFMNFTPTVMVGKEQGFAQSHRHYDDRAFPDTLRLVFKQCFKNFRHEYPKKRNAMRRTIEQLEEFSKVSNHKPKFFVDIAHQYDGDISAYVKDMYDQSCLLNGKQFQRFLRKPSAVKLQNDMGVQFVIGIALYRLWIREQAEK